MCVVVFRHLLVAVPPSPIGSDEQSMMSVDNGEGLGELNPLDNESRFDPEYVSDGGGSGSGDGDGSYLNAGDYQPRPPDAALE